MGISKDYFLDEVRDGFLIPGRMKRAWKKDLKSYRQLENTCDKLGVSVSAMWGTLLGAIRDGGFIPWDDDIDLQMIHSEYDIVYDYFKKNEKEKYWISDYRFDEKENMTRKFMSSKSLIEPYEEWKNSFGFPYVSILDIFVLEYMPVNEEIANEYWENLYEAGRLKEYDKIRDKKVLDTKFSAEIKQLEKKMGVSADRISDAPWFIRILAMMDEYTARFSADDCEYISIPAYYDRSHNMKFSKRIYEHYIDVRFEDETIRVPIGYDWILRILYGNYMRPYMAPGAHDYPFYLAMDRDAKTASGYGLLSYEYDAGKINDIKKTAKSADKKDAKERAVGSVLLLEEAHESMKVLFYAEKDDNQNLLALIGQCQELAIEIGNDIEKNTVNPTDFVTVLEGYCEYLYSQYTILSQAGNNSIVFDDIFDKLVVFSNEMKSESEKLISKKEIVFLVGRAKDWDSLHDLWTEAKNDKRYNVTVLSIPMYYKDFDGKILKDEKIEDEVRYPEEVKFSDYETYDFKLNHPEIVVYQYPYDEYSDVMSVHPYFYAQNIAKFTDTMVLASPYELDRNKVLNGPSMYTVGTFLKNPGGCLADVILARSEQEKQAFEMILTDFAPDRAEKIKIIVNEKNKLCDLKVNDKEKDSKKVLLFTMNASMLYVFGEKAINKAKKVFDIFEKYSDKMEVIWYPDPYANQILQHDEILKKQYDDLVEKYRDKLNLWEGGIETEGHLAQKCDGVYGSGCVLMSECRKAGKAVLFEDPCVDISEFEPTGRILTGNEGVTEEGIHPGQWGVEEFVVALLNHDEEARDDVACEEANFGVFQRIFS